MTLDEETRALIRAAGAMSNQVDALRRRLEREGRLLTPVQFDRVSAALARVGMLGGVLLADDLARTYDAEGDRPLDGPVDGAPRPPVDGHG